MQIKEYFSCMNRTGRLPRIHIKNTIHHIMIRGNNRQKIFLNNTCFLYFLKIIDESTKKFDHKILAYCLMSNHAHFVIHIHNDSLSKIMKNINYRYARWFNKKYKRIGHLFQGRYRSIAIDNEEYLVNLCHYIHFNPVEAKIVPHPDYYRYSSHHDYLSQKPPEWMEIILIKTAIQHKTGHSYLQFINKPINREKWKPGLYISENGELVIDYDVVRNLHPTLNQIKNKNVQKNFLSQESIKKIVCKNLNINEARLFSKARDRKTSHQRTLLVHFWITYSNMTMKGVANNLCRTQGTLQRQLDNFINSNMNYFSGILIDTIQMELKAELRATYAEQSD